MPLFLVDPALRDLLERPEYSQFIHRESRADMTGATQMGGRSLRLVLCGGIASGMLLSCGGGTSHERLTLPSGRQVEIVGTAEMVVGNGDRALAIDYRTTVDLDDPVARLREADEVWAIVKGYGPKGPLTAVVLGAQRVSGSSLGGLVKSAKGFRFVIERNADGTWPDHVPDGPPGGRKK